MSPLRRTALVSVAAAAMLLVLKLATGLASGSLGLVSEALHSGTDLVAALLTFFALGVAGRPADEGHQYGHGKAEHLAALAEAAVLAVVSVAVAAFAVARLTGAIETEVETAWWTFAVIGLVIAIDVTRTVVSYRAARRYDSEALLSNALHFGSDLAGTLAVLAGLVAAAAGFPSGDSFAALFVAALVVLAAGRLIRRNVDVLMDQAPADAEDGRSPGDPRRAGRRALAPSPPSGRRTDVRGRRDRGLAGGRSRAGTRARRPRSRTRSSGCCPGATWSCTSSRASGRRRCASAPTPRRCRCRACGRSTTSPSSPSTARSSSRCT